MTSLPLRRAETCDVRSVSATYRDGFHVGRHRHDWAQLIHARSGVMRVQADSRLWLIPPTRALWIPANMDHEFVVRGEVAFRTLYVAGERACAVARGLSAFEVGPFLRELILHILTLETLDPNLASHDRLAGLLVNLVESAPGLDLMLPLPVDKRARRLADHFQAQPDDASDLPRLAAKTGASVRTLQRAFITETGLTIDSWRQKARLIGSTAALSNGANVTMAAMDFGYDSPSAYIAAFKRHFGMTPRQFARQR